MRPPTADIAAPPFPRGLTWINTAPLRMDRLIGQPVLIEFWDFCRPNSLRTLPYLKDWSERYQPDGLRVIGVHAAGFEASRDPEAVRDAVARLDVPYPVVVDAAMEIWGLYGNLGWPARYLFDQHGALFDYHYGEGAYDETERAIQELLGVERAADRAQAPRGRPRGTARAPVRRRRRARTRGRTRPAPCGACSTAPARSAPTARTVTVDHPGCYPLIEHDRHTAGELDLRVGEGVRCDGVCFLPGLID